MKFILEQSDEWEDVEIRIRCGQMTSSLEKIIQQIRLYGFSIMGEKEGEMFPISFEQIYYFEAVDNRAYAYCENEVYQCKQKLYELEERLGNINFQRISRSCILNVHRLLSIRTLLNGKIEATMENGEKLIVNRHYAEELREKIYSQGEI